MKVTYLFGAGASKQALPIVNEIPERLDSVISLLKKPEFSLPENERFEEMNLQMSKKEAQNVLIKDLEWILEKSSKHASIDTFAKKLFIKGQHEELNRLKLAFSVYFVIEHFLNPPDPRYDAFYASILNRGIRDFPSNVRILSWNYDMQFESAFTEYIDNPEVGLGTAVLNIVSKFQYPNLGNDKFNILKLNGSTVLMQFNGRSHYHFFSRFQNSLDIETLSTAVRNYANLRLANGDGFSGMSFAWEKTGSEENDIILHAKKQTEDTSVLVVIGYSFPYFNREIDRKIIRNMNQLQKVYFQAPDAPNILERFLSVRDDISAENLITRVNTDQFLLPSEL